MTGERDEAREFLVVGHRPPGSVPDGRDCSRVAVSRTRPTTVDDLQASRPDVRLGLTRAGVTGVSKAIRIRHAGREKTFAAEISCAVDLDRAQKGVHMSRFPELFEEAIDEVGDRRGVPRRGAGRARRAADRPAGRARSAPRCGSSPSTRSSGRTPVTGLRTQEMASLHGIAAASPSGVRRVIGVEATGINACPCAQGLVRGAAADRLREAGFGRGRRRPDPRARAARDAQPARPRHALRRHRRGASTPRTWCGSSSVDELSDLRAAEAARRALRRRARAPAAALRRGLRPGRARVRARGLSGARRRATSCSRARSTSRRSTPTTSSRSARAPSGSCAPSSTPASPAQRHTELRDWLAG